MSEPDESAGGPIPDLRALLHRLDGAALTTEDLLFQTLPLLRAMRDLHTAGKVAAIAGAADILAPPEAPLALRRPDGMTPTANLAEIFRVQPAAGSALKVVGEYRVTVDAGAGTAVDNLSAVREADAAITKPVYLPGFSAWELALGHHDEITDVLLVGQVVASLALGLDLGDADDLARFADHRGNLFRLNSRLNPVVASVIVEMTALNRHERAKDLSSVIHRLETWREQKVGLDLDQVLADAKGVAPRRTAVMSHLRDRLFDLSRRSRLVYFRPTQATVNLTVASVPMVLQIKAIKPQDLCTWGGDFAKEVIAGKPIAVQRWLRFEDQPYLPVSLDRLISEARRDRAEYGFSNLRLVIAFLRWNNLKEAPDERITSPLLWLPVELVKKKGVRDQYVLQCPHDEAEFNPALRHHLRQLYDIRLPETVDLGDTPLERVHADLAAQIHRSEPGVDLRLVTQPEIEFIHQKAVQRLQQFQRRRGRTRVAETSARPDFSYEADDYRPLGLALFRQKVSPSPLPLRAAVGAAPIPRDRAMAPEPALTPGVDTVEHATFSLPADRGHRFAWDFDLTQVTLANFNYRKMSLVRDYAQILDEGLESPAFDRVFSVEPRQIETEPPPPVPLQDRWTVVASDETQTAAVALARTGKSFIIQGPPGTGKSQTITNLIADYAGRGKRVLFVCEKRAALDVVFHRLKSAGLAELCCLIHDSQTDKKAFVQNLKEGYERWAGAADGRDAALAARAAAQAAEAEALATIGRFESAMCAVPPQIAASVRTLVRRRLGLPAPADVGAKARERLPDIAVWDANAELVGRLYRLLRERLGTQSLARHPAARLAGTLVAGEHAFAAVSDLIDACDDLLDRLDLDDDAGRLLSGDTPVAEAAPLTALARRIAGTGLAPHLAVLERAGAAAAEFAARRQGLEAARATLAEAAKATVNWREPLAPDDTAAALDMATRTERSLLRLFSPAWWRLTGELKRRYDFSKHAVRPPFSRVLSALAAQQAAADALGRAEASLRADYGLADLDAALALIDELAAALPASALARRLVDHVRDATDPAAAARADGAAADAAAALAARLQGAADLPASFTLAELGEWLRDLREALDDLPDLLPLLRAVHAAGGALAGALQTLDLPAAGFEALIADETLARLLRLDPELAQFDGEALAEAAAKAASAGRAGLRRNAAALLAGRRRRFLDNVKRSAQSVTDLDAQGRQFKKAYATGRRELEHEFGKTMRFRSIRDLADGEPGEVLRDLKPIWLMSPLSVSDTLPLTRDLFDVVIFDEASQIPSEEAAPALSRARQIVVVGDEMQLPPTSFFSSAPGEDEVELTAEEDGERVAISMDADSLLAQAARNLPATLLAWHYRSRHEALISFSNAAFYDGRLITVPDRAIQKPQAEVAVLRSDDAAAAARGADLVLERPISVHRIADGVYGGRANLPEARYIAALVRELLRREDNMSLGVVAFSEAQQGEIEAALDALGEEDPAFAARLEQEYTREEDGQFSGFFVKNLENVQGDERDVMILSICYAPDANGRMAMNFGPINQRGGEKRLNVIFSRARHRMAVVSTIGPEAITNLHNDGAAALAAFLRFAEASARGEAEQSQAVLGTLNPGARAVFAAEAPADAARSGLARALRQRGHVVREYVGQSQFRCDLAIVDDDEERFVLGILIDAAPGTDSAAEVAERYVFRPSVLRAFGWPVVDVPSIEWLRAPDKVLDRIDRALARAEAGLDDEDDEAVAGEDMAEVDEGPLPPPMAAPTLPMRSFTFKQGTSDKVWKIGVADREVTVAFGRTGARLQTVIKTYDTPRRAQREADKLIEEKVRKGYLEAAA